MNASRHKGVVMRPRVACAGGLLVILALLSGVRPAVAGDIVVLDQQFDPGPGGVGLWVRGPGRFSPTLLTDYAQTFTVGVTGTLTRVEVLIGDGQSALFPNDPAVLQVHRTDAAGRPIGSGVPVGGEGLLLTSGVPLSSLPHPPGYVSFDFGLGLPVQQGDTLALVLRAFASDESYALVAGSGNPYPRGDLYVRQPFNTGDTWLATPGLDAGFRTYVATPVPEPAGLTVAGACLAALMGHWFRHRGKK